MGVNKLYESILTTAGTFPKDFNSKNKTEIQAVTPIAAADASNEATLITLANETKTKFNALLAALKA